MNQNRIAEYLLSDITSPHIIIGPLVWQPSNGITARRWYFTLARFTAEFGFDLFEVEVDSDDLLARSALKLALIQLRQRPIILHDVDDELEMAKLCETLWPSERISHIRASIEAERSAGQPS
jgi:hypothetical protein